MSRRFFQITMKVPIGERTGRLWWDAQGETLQGALEILGHENPVTGRLRDQQLELEGSIVTLVRSIPWTASGNLQGERLRLTLHGPRHNWTLEGSETAGD